MTDDTTPTTGSSSDPSDDSAASSDELTAPGPDRKDTDAETEGSTASAPHRRKGFVRRHWVLVSIGVVLLLVLGSAGGYLYWVEHQFSNIHRVTVDTLTENERTPDHLPTGSGEKNRPLNILLLGADNGGDTQSVADDLKDGKWTPFAHRSDTLMIAHVPADRKSVQLVSIPRDTWVKIDGYPYADGHGKINAAFAFGGPSLAAKTVQQLTGITIDHLAVIDWAGFKDLTTALDGVRVYIPETFYDDSQRITWQKGWQTLKGTEALQYVRTRHGLANGDFGRIERQQNFLRATMGKLLSKTHNIIAMTKVINVITKYLTIDSTWSNSEILNLALSLRGLHDSDVEFLTAPLGQYATSADGQSIVQLAPKQSRLLFEDVKTDDISDYLKKYPQTKLPGDKAVS
jgi:LCP family protein required for cell wall assembly